MIQKIYFSLSDTFAAFSMRAEASSSLPLAISHRGDSIQLICLKEQCYEISDHFLFGQNYLLWPIMILWEYFNFAK